jgi:putative transposase
LFYGISSNQGPKDKVERLKKVINPNHIHILVDIPPFMIVSRFVQCLKGESSSKLQMEFPQLGKQFWSQHMWAIGYFCATNGVVTEKEIV